MVFHVFYLIMMPFSMPRKLQKGLFFSPVSPNFGRVTRPMNPISLPSTPQNSTSAPLFRCPETPFLIPQTAFWDTPNGQMGVFYNTSCCHSYGCFTPLKRVFCLRTAQKKATKRVYMPRSKTDPPSIKRTLDAGNHKERPPNHGKTLLNDGVLRMKMTQNL